MFSFLLHADKIMKHRASVVVQARRLRRSPVVQLSPVAAFLVLLGEDADAVGLQGRDSAKEQP